MVTLAKAFDMKSAERVALAMRFLSKPGKLSKRNTETIRRIKRKWISIKKSIERIFSVKTRKSSREKEKRSDVNDGLCKVPRRVI